MYREGMTLSGSATIATSVSRQSRTNMNASVVPSVMSARTAPKIVSEITFSIRPTSLLIRDITSPVRLRVKNPTDWPSSRSNSCQRQSAMIPWLIDVDR